MDVNDVYILFILRDGAIHSSMFGNIWGGGECSHVLLFFNLKRKSFFFFSFSSFFYC